MAEHRRRTSGLVSALSQKQRSDHIAPSPLANPAPQGPASPNFTPSISSDSMGTDSNVSSRPLSAVDPTTPPAPISPSPRTGPPPVAPKPKLSTAQAQHVQLARLSKQDSLEPTSPPNLTAPPSQSQTPSQGDVPALSDDFIEELCKAFPTLSAGAKHGEIQGQMHMSGLQEALAICGIKLPMYKIRDLEEDWKTEKGADAAQEIMEAADFLKIYGEQKRKTTVQFRSRLHKMESIARDEQSGGGGGGEAHVRAARPITVHAIQFEEQVALADWVNQTLANDKLSRRYLPLLPDGSDLYEKCRDSVVLYRLIDNARPGMISEKSFKLQPASVYHRLENGKHVLSAARTLGCNIVNLEPSDLEKGTDYLILGLLWQLVKLSLLMESTLTRRRTELVDLLQPSESPETLTSLSSEQIILRWVNYHLDRAACGRRCENFTEDLKDSVIFIQLLKQVAPDYKKISTEALDEPNLVKRAELMLDEAAKLKCKVFLTAQNIVSPTNDKLNIAFLANLFNKYPRLKSLKMIIEEIKDKEDDAEEEERRRRIKRTGKKFVPFAKTYNPDESKTNWAPIKIAEVKAPETFELVNVNDVSPAPPPEPELRPEIINPETILEESAIEVDQASNSVASPLLAVANRQERVHSEPPVANRTAQPKQTAGTFAGQGSEIGPGDKIGAIRSSLDAVGPLDKANGQGLGPQAKIGSPQFPRAQPNAGSLPGLGIGLGSELMQAQYLENGQIKGARASVSSDLQEHETEVEHALLYKRVDEHAVEVSRCDFENFKDLIYALIYTRNITDELEKVRAIFLWLCTKDLSRMNFENTKPDSPEEILMNLKRDKTSYAKVFETLCGYAGVHSKIITGYAKGVGYEPGMHFEGSAFNHMWNAVHISGSWRLIDAEWGSRHIMDKSRPSETLRYRLDEFYYLPSAYQFIYTHWPFEEKWQLLEKPFSREDFETLPFVKSTLFSSGLALQSHQQAVIQLDASSPPPASAPPQPVASFSPALDITLSILPNFYQRLFFTVKLLRSDGGDKFAGLPLQNWAIHEKLPYQAKFHIRFPEPGEYFVTAYVRDTSHAALSSSPEDAPPTSNTASGETSQGNDVRTVSFDSVCKYRVSVCGFTSAQAPPPFPPCFESHYGLTEQFFRYRLEREQPVNLLQSSDGQFEVALRLPQRLNTLARLKCSSHDESVLQRSLVQRILPLSSSEELSNGNAADSRSGLHARNSLDPSPSSCSSSTSTSTDSALPFASQGHVQPASHDSSPSPPSSTPLHSSSFLYKITGCLPESGEYALEIFAGDPTIDANNLHAVCRLLVNYPSKTRSDLKWLPEFVGDLTFGQVAHPRLEEVGLHPLGAAAEDAFIRSNRSELELTFKKTKPARLAAQLFRAEDTRSSVDVSTYLLMLSNKAERSVCFKFRLPRDGFYKFQVFGIPEGDKGSNLPNLYNYLLFYKPAENDRLSEAPQIPYPSQFQRWSEDCYLFEPREGRLRISTNTDSRPARQVTGPVLFQMLVPTAAKINLVIGEEWLPMANKSLTGTQGLWELETNLSKFAELIKPSSSIKLGVYANFGSNATTFSPLLQFELV